MEVIGCALSAGFHLIIQRALPPPVGSSDRVTRYKYLIAADSFGKCPRARTTLRYLALIDTGRVGRADHLADLGRRIRGTARYCAQEERQSCTIAGYRSSHSAANSANLSFAAGSDEAVEGRHDRVPVLPARIPEAVTEPGERCTTAPPSAPRSW